MICLTFICNKLPDAAINGCDWWKWTHQLFHAVYLGGIWGIAVSLLLPICSITLMAAPRSIWHVVSIHTTIDATLTNCIYRWSERIKYEKPYHNSAKFAGKNTIDKITKVEFASGTAWPVAINSTFCVQHIVLKHNRFKLSNMDSICLAQVADVMTFEFPSGASWCIAINITFMSNIL